MPANRLLPTEEAADLLRLTRDIVTKELAPRVAEAEATETFPREVFRTLGRAGLLSLPYPEEYGGGGQPYEVYLQVLEEIAAVWASVGVGVSVHALSCFGLYTRGTEEQKQRLAPRDARRRAARRLRALRAARRLRPGGDDDQGGARRRRLRPHRHQGLDHPRRARGLLQGDGPHQRRPQRHLLLPRARPTPTGSAADPPERKMGLTGSTHDHAPARRGAGPRRPAARRGGRGAADRARGARLRTARDRRRRDRARPGRARPRGRLRAGARDLRQADHRPPGARFVLADMAAAVESARATTLHAARLRDRGLPFGKEASIAKLVATDNAMKVTTDAVQVLGGYGYTRDFPVERYMREAKVMQIFEGTNQIQRMVIARHLDRRSGGTITSP